MDYNAIGHESLCAFVRTTQTVISRTSFDHLIAASDSGQLATHIATEVYNAAGIAVPPEFCAPIYRHVDKERTIVFDNSTLAPWFSDWREASMGNALFVDDEIWRGNTLNGILDLLFALHVKIDYLTVMAEDGGFQYGQVLRGIPLRFVAPKLRVPEIYNAFSYTTPPEFHDPVYNSLNEPGLNHKQIMCTLLGFPIKDRSNGTPEFSTRLLEKARAKLPELPYIQRSYRAWLRHVIHGYME